MGFLEVPNVGVNISSSVTETPCKPSRLPYPQSSRALEGLSRPLNDSSGLLGGLGHRNLFSGNLNIDTVRLGGVPYRSLSRAKIYDIAGGIIGEVDRVNSGVVGADSKKLKAALEKIRGIGPYEMINRIKRAGDYFLNDRLSLGGIEAGPEEYCKLQAALIGAPVHHCLRNMEKIHTTMVGLHILLRNHLAEWRHDISLDQVLSGSRADLQLQATSLGAQLPSNSPGVLQLLIPFLPFVPLLLKPGSGDVLSPLRLRAACMKAGLPEESISLYFGSGQEVVRELRERCSHFMMFGSANAIKPFRGNPAVDVHGPGYSKVIFGPDLACEWERFIPVVVEGIIHNGGRSCINTSVVIAPSQYAKQIADRLAIMLSSIHPLPLSDPNATLSAYHGMSSARAIYQLMLAQCQAGGGEMLSERFGAPIVECPTASYLRPTVAYFPQMSKHAVKWEFLAPSVAVVAWDGEDLATNIKRTLICTPITEDVPTLRALTRAPKLALKNTAIIPTSRINPYAPIETNVMRFLFAPPGSGEE